MKLLLLCLVPLASANIGNHVRVSIGGSTYEHGIAVDHGHAPPAPAPYHPPPTPHYASPAPKPYVPQHAPAYVPHPTPVYHHKPTPTYHKPAPVYHKPAPAYHKPAPAYHKPAPAYHAPKHNCSVVDVTEPATVCTPTFKTMCAPVDLAIKKIVDKSQCEVITRTVCTESTMVVPNEVCTYRYRSKADKTTATTVKVSFEKQCDTMMVTVCQPGGYGHHGHHGYGGYGASHQYCKEVAQETCYNVPMVMEDVQDVTVTYPEPVKTCIDKPISLPKVACEDIAEEKCITVPEIMDDTISVEKCEVSLGEPACKTVDLVLPKQVCVELVYGHAYNIPEKEYKAMAKRI